MSWQTVTVLERNSANRRGLVFLIGIALAFVPSRVAIAREELVALSDFFAVKRVSGGIGIYKWERNQIYVLTPGKKPELIGTVQGGPPRGMGPLSDATQHLRAITMAISKDGRSLVFRQAPRAKPKNLETGIYQYVYGTGIKMIHSQQVLSFSYTHYEKAFPSDFLPFRYRITYTPTDLTWALNASGEEFPLALLDATPLHWAAFEGRSEECIALVKGGADINAKTFWDFAPIELAIIRDQQDAAIQLLALGADPNAGSYPAFHLAVMLARMKVFRAMIERGADTNAIDHGGRTPLHVAVTVGHNLAPIYTFFDSAETPRSILDKQVTTTLVRTLLENGADPGIRNKSNKTPLDVVSSIAPAEVRELLTAHSKPQ